MGILEALQLEACVDPEHFTVVSREQRRHDELAIFVYRDEASVEGGVEVGGEEEALEDVEMFGVGAAGCPGFDVAGP